MNGQVYVLKVDGQPVFKIGFTGGKVSDRIKDLQTGNPHKIRQIYSGFVENEAGVERYLHGHFKTCKMQGEWYKLDSNQLAEAIRIIQGFQLELALKLSIDIKPIAAKTAKNAQDNARLTDELLMDLLEDNKMNITTFVFQTLKITDKNKRMRMMRRIVNLVLKSGRDDLRYTLAIDYFGIAYFFDVDGIED